MSIVVRLLLLPALCPRALVLMRWVTVVMGTMLPLGEDVDEVVAHPSLISMVRKVFMSGSASPWVTCCPAALPGALSSFELLEACTSFSAGCLVPPTEVCHWLAEDRGLLATPLGWGVVWFCDVAEVWDRESSCGLAALSPDGLRDAAVCVHSSVALERLAWPLPPDAVPFLRGAFFKAGTFWIWAVSVNLRIRSRTELVRLNCSNTICFFSGAIKDIYIGRQLKLQEKNLKQTTTQMPSTIQAKFSTLSVLLSPSFTPHQKPSTNPIPLFLLSPGLVPSPLFCLTNLPRITVFQILFCGLFRTCFFHSLVFFSFPDP